MMATLPTTKQEDWRWADLSHARALMETPAAANDSAPDVDVHWLTDGERHLYVGGQRVGGAAPPAAGATVASPPHPLADLAANAEAFVLEVPDGADGGAIELMHVGTTGTAHGRTVVRLGAGARLQLVETFTDAGADHWLNHRFDAELGEGAVLTRIVRFRTTAGLVTDRAFANIGIGSRFVTLLVGQSSASLRADVEVDIQGAGAHADVNGILLGDDSAAQDVLTRVRHSVPDATSSQKWRLVAGGKSRLSVAGGVNVARDAQHTDAEQSLKALVLRRTASANLKPELEIFADDVKCAHGCTVGALDKASLFYLQSRGISREEAEALLTRAFVADALKEVEGPLAELLDAETQGWLAEAAGQAR